MIYHPVQYFSLSHKLIYPIKNILIIILFKTFLVTKINLPEKNIGLSTCSILFFAKNQCTWSKTGQYSWGTFSIVFRLIVLSSAARLRNRGILFKRLKGQLFKVKTWAGKMMLSSFENLENYEIQFAKGNSFLKVKEEHLICENTCRDLYLIFHNTCSDLYIISYILYITTPVVTYIPYLISCISQHL